MQVKALAMVCVLAAGCGDDDGSAIADARTDAVASDASIDSPPGGFTVNGTIATSGSANGVFVAWSVSSGSPDYLWKFGQGTSTATTFMVTMSSEPPAQAINSFGVAVGFVVMIPDGVQLPADGMIEESNFEPIGITPRHAIIYRTATSTIPGWPEAFPVGYACGMCVDQTTTFDAFVVTDCGNVEMVRGPIANVCNWT